MAAVESNDAAGAKAPAVDEFAAKVQRLRDEGRRKLREEQYEAAAQDFSAALVLTYVGRYRRSMGPHPSINQPRTVWVWVAPAGRTERYGTLARECADLYYLYGRALTLNIASNQQLFGGEAGEAAAANDEDDDDDDDDDDNDRPASGSEGAAAGDKAESAQASGSADGAAGGTGPCSPGTSARHCVKRPSLTGACSLASVARLGSQRRRTPWTTSRLLGRPSRRRA